MKAMILAAGRGQRMMPLTASVPKPMLTIMGKPLIEYHIERLKAAGITEIVINLAWHANKITEYFADGQAFGVNIHYSQEPEQGLETAGGIVRALPFLGDDFIVINGDVFTDYDVNALKTLHLDEGESHIVLVENPPHNPNGDFTLRHLGPQSQKYTFSGISRFKASFFQGIPDGVLPLGPLLREGLALADISTELYIGMWNDIGTPERLTQLNEQLTETLKGVPHVG